MGRTTRGGSASKWSMTEFGPLSPDMPDLVNSGMNDGQNIMPLATGFYGPVRDPEDASNNSIVDAGGVPIRASGDLFSYFDPFANDNLHFAGSAADAAGDARLYLLNDSGARTWSDASRPGGYSANVFRAWRWSSFANDVIAVNSTTPMQYFRVGTSTAFADIPNAPLAHDVATVGEFLVAINTNDFTYGEGFQPYRVGWSAQGDALNWPAPFTPAALNVRSDIQDLFGGGRLQRIIPGIGGADAIIVGERRMWRMHRTGGPDIFRFDPVEFDGGTHAPGSVAAFNEMFFYYSSGFKIFDGANSTPIGRGIIDEFFNKDADFSSVNGFQRAMCSAIDGERSIVIWSYRSKDAPTEFNNRMIFYNWVSRRWGVADIGFDAMGMLSTGRRTLDDPVTHFMGQDFTTQLLSGVTREAILESKEFEIGNGQGASVKGVRPVIDASTVYAQARTRDRVSQPFEDSPEKLAESDGVVPIDEVGRYYRARCRVPAGEEWNYALGCEFEVAPWSDGSGRLG